MRVKVIKCSDPIYWYNNKIGQIFEVKNEQLVTGENDNLWLCVHYSEPKDEENDITGYSLRHGDYEIYDEHVEMNELKKRIEQLEQQIKELQQRPPIVINNPYPVYPSYPQQPNHCPYNSPFYLTSSEQAREEALKIANAINDYNNKSNP